MKENFNILYDVSRMSMDTTCPLAYNGLLATVALDIEPSIPLTRLAHLIVDNIAQEFVELPWFQALLNGNLDKQDEVMKIAAELIIKQIADKYGMSVTISYK